MTDPEESSNPLQNLLGDLLKVVGGTTGGMPPWWEAAKSLAYGVATDGAPEGNADPLERMRLSDLARVAELHVAEFTGLPLSPDGQPLTFTGTGRGTWSVRVLEAWRPYLDAMVKAQEGSTGLPDIAGLGQGGLGFGFDEQGTDGLQELLGRFAVTMGPVLMGLQFGSTAGHLARRALGQYAVPLPWPPGHELLVVPENVKAFADDWSLPVDQTELWVCIRELTTHAVLGRPHVAERVRDLLREATTEAAGFQREIADRLGGQVSDPEALQSIMGDPESLLADLLTPGARPGSARLTALITALGGYVDHATTVIAQRLTASSATLGEAWYRYRIDDAKGEQAAAALFGIDIGRTEVDRGAAFVKGVLDRAGEEGLARLWSSDRTLPTPAEVDAPGLWLERIDLPQDELPGPSAQSGPTAASTDEGGSGPNDAGSDDAGSDESDPGAPEPGQPG